MLEALVNKYLCNLDEQPLTAFEREWEAQVIKNHRKVEELGVVIEGFGDTDETYLDLQDESVALTVEVLVLPYIKFGREGRGRVQIAMQCFAVWIAMQFVHASCLNLFLQFQRPV